MFGGRSNKSLRMKSSKVFKSNNSQQSNHSMGHLPNSESRMEFPIAHQQITQRIFIHESESYIEDNYQKTKHYECLYLQYKFNIGLQCIFSIVSIISSIITYEAIITEKSKFVSIIASSVAVANSCLLYVTIIFEYYIRNRIIGLITKLPMKFIDDATKRFYVFLYIMLFFVTPLPITTESKVSFYNTTYEVYYDIPLNGLLTLLCMFRLWFSIKYYLVSCRYSRPRSERICNINGFNTNLYFALKGMMLTSPFQICGLLFLKLIFFSSYAIRVFESGIDDYSPTHLEFSNFWNCLWCLIITMTTVGYGDYVPSTELGRVLVVISSFCGVILLSLVIVSITNVLNLQGNENSIYIMLERLDAMALKDSSARKLVSRYVQLHRKIKKKQRINIREERDEFANFRNEFKNKVKELDNSFPAYTGMDNIKDHLMFLEKSSVGLYEKYSDLSILMDKVVDKLNI
jgi:hypothetical protein